MQLPHELFVPAENPSKDFSGYCNRLRDIFNNFRPVPVQHKTRQSFFVHPDLLSASKVYLRVDRVQRPLEPPYTRPFPVLKRHRKTFTIEVKGKPVTVILDRLKPAFELADESSSTLKSGSAPQTATAPLHSATSVLAPVVTRYGRTSKPPSRFGLVQFNSKPVVHYI